MAKAPWYMRPTSGQWIKDIRGHERYVQEFKIIKWRFYIHVCRKLLMMYPKIAWFRMFGKKK